MTWHGSNVNEAGSDTAKVTDPAVSSRLGVIVYRVSFTSFSFSLTSFPARLSLTSPSILHLLQHSVSSSQYFFPLKVVSTSEFFFRRWSRTNFEKLLSKLYVIFVLILSLASHTHVCATRRMPLRAKASSITLGPLRMLQVVEFKSSQVSGNSWCTSLLWSSRAQSFASLSVTHPHLPGILNFLQPDQMAAPFAVSFDIWTPISPAPQHRDLRLTTQSVSPPPDAHKLLHTRTHTRQASAHGNIRLL